MNFYKPGNKRYMVAFELSGNIFYTKAYLDLMRYIVTCKSKEVENDWKI